MSVAGELSSKRLGFWVLSAPRMQPAAGIIDGAGASADEPAFFIDLVQAAIKSPAHSPLEMAAQQEGEQILREWGIARDGHPGVWGISANNALIGKRESR
jgi:hypothetical protein